MASFIIFCTFTCVCDHASFVWIYFLFPALRESVQRWPALPRVWRASKPTLSSRRSIKSCKRYEEHGSFNWSEFKGCGGETSRVFARGSSENRRAAPKSSEIVLLPRFNPVRSDPLCAFSLYWLVRFYSDSESLVIWSDKYHDFSVTCVRSSLSKYLQYSQYQHMQLLITKNKCETHR